jgi:hypothetical protein
MVYFLKKSIVKNPREAQVRPFKEVNGREVNGREVNGREVNGREVNGREVNGRKVNGREVNGREVNVWFFINLLMKVRSAY